ncbi:hypothetical protein Pla175_19930 [Pirellulimonas nuda]|uniref:YetF C-terminal domain-containing protein n=1 Tax=Pirellulimonas nuda TaxID=2528009 RepID=A0A518DAZ0_9BACT|nr:DUF421 domain-containing protein [Pirellulimonas nuda]QDU88613.1 hypothetical protein Pla175_19930 [Pirellulimonas nuda]
MIEFDLQRIFLGDKPLWFLLEVAFRTIVIFGYTLVLLRWMGKRGMGNLTPFEFAIIIALGSAVGDPMFYDDVPLLHTMLVIALIVGMQQLLSVMTEKHPRIERALMSSPRLLVYQGTINCDNLHCEELSCEDLFQALREQGVRQLGEVELAFLEPSGKLSVLRFASPRAGLSVLPTSPDGGPPDPDPAPGLQSCRRCGLTRRRGGATEPSCPSCHAMEWTTSVMPADKE